jgi:stearoyl-CoA desaturase (delta-9 desaturase)
VADEKGDRKMAAVDVPKTSYAPVYKEGGPVGRMMVYAFVVIPLLAVLASAFVARHGWFSWQDAVIAVVFYCITNIGVGVGFHRYFTHSSFKANTPLRLALAIAGSLAIEGPVIGWVATHRRHHQFSDKEGDPHSPWRFGTTPKAIAKGFYYAHVGWLFSKEGTDRDRYAKNLQKDPAIRWISNFFPLFVAASLILPALCGWLWGGFTLRAALLAFFWAGLVRMALMHHVTWSINSVCHLWGDEPFRSRDKSRNVWWLAILSFGESWHNLHHADATCARHGVDKGQIDINARTIWFFERLGWATDVRWPQSERIAAKRA